MLEVRNASCTQCLQFDVDDLIVEKMELKEIDELLDKVCDSFPLARGAILNYALRKFGKDLEQIKQMTPLEKQEAAAKARNATEFKEYYVMVNNLLGGWVRLYDGTEDRNINFTESEAIGFAKQLIQNGSYRPNQIMVVKKVNVKMEVEF